MLPSQTAGVCTDMAPSLDEWFYKVERFGWRGKTYELGLSHALFSSDRIDDGSKALLGVLDARMDDRSDVPRVNRVYDIGCGNGVLGICVAGGLSAAELILEDRDALAVALAVRNAERNALECRTVPYPRPTGIGAGVESDLIVCNVPAKAGEPVHRLIIDHALANLAPSGVFLLVVVNPIADSLAMHLQRRSAHIERHAFPGHTVFAVEHTPTTRVIEPPLPDAYRRGEQVTLEFRGIGYEFTPTLGLGEFDGPSYTTAMLARLALERCADRPAVLYEPGAGHLPLILSRLPEGSRPRSYLFACRNTLALHALETLNTFPGVPYKSEICERPYELRRFVTSDVLVVMPVVPEPHTPFVEELRGVAEAVSHAGGVLAIAGASATISRLEKRRLPLRIVRRTKSRGVRGLILTPRDRAVR